MTTLYTVPQVVDAIGGVENATAEFFESGTATGLDVYSDLGLTMLLGNEITADATGRFTAVYLQEKSYRVTVKVDGAVLYSQDDINNTQSTGALTVIVDDANATANAQAAYAEGNPIAYYGDTQLRIVVDPAGEALTDDKLARGVVIQDAYAWQLKCEGTMPILELADGYHECQAQLILREGTIHIEASGPPTFVQINSVAFTSLGSDVYEATITVDTALPTRVVTGYGIGVPVFIADNDGKALNGLHIVKNVAGDRLSWTCDIYSPRALTAPTDGSILRAVVKGLAAGNCHVYQACIHHDDDSFFGGLGSAVEGIYNQEREGVIIMKNMGIAYDAGIGGHRDLFFLRDAGAKLYFLDYCGVGGAEDKTIRLFSGAYFLGNRCIIGASNSAGECVHAQDDSHVTMVRCTVGGGRVANYTFTDSARAQLTEIMNASAKTGVLVTGQECSITYQKCETFGCLTGHNLVSGLINFGLGAAGSTTTNCTTGTRYQGGSSRYDPVYTNCGTDVNGPKPQQEYHGHSARYTNPLRQTSIAGLKEFGIANGGVFKFDIESEEVSGCGIVKVAAVSRGSGALVGSIYYWHFDRTSYGFALGADTVFNTADLSSVTVDVGKMTIGVFDNVGTAELHIRNDTGGTIRVSILFEHDVREA